MKRLPWSCIVMAVVLAGMSWSILEILGRVR